MSVTTIQTMLRRFSEDLARLTATIQEPENGISLAAAQFVRKTRFNIAHRIWEAYHEGPDDHRETSNNITDTVNDSDDPDEIEDDNDKDFVYEVSEHFIFDTTPILSFQADVKRFVATSHARDDGIASRIYQSAEVCFSNFRSVIHEPPLEPGRKRLRWKCVSPVFNLI